MEVLTYSDSKCVGTMEIKKINESDDVTCMATGTLNGKEVKVLYMADLDYGILIPEDFAKK